MSASWLEVLALRLERKRLVTRTSADRLTERRAPLKIEMNGGNR